MFRTHVLPWLIWIFYRLWFGTWRLHVIESPGLKKALADGEKIVFAHWHGTELAIVSLIRTYRIATMTSTSKDGELMDFTVRRFGGATSRGSSTRGGIGALKGLIRLMSNGYRASMAVDGPKGPLHVVKPGVFELSRLAQARIVAMGSAASREIVFQKSWNKATLPKPFSRVVVYFGEPWPVITKDQSAKDEKMALRLADEISRACVTAAEHLTSKGSKTL